jgi:hypothetical protein
MMMMNNGQSMDCQAVEGTIPEMPMRITTVKIRRTCRALRHVLGKGREERMARGTGRQLRMGRGKEWARARELVKGKVLLNKPQGEMISLVPLICSCRMKSHRQTWTGRANKSRYS